LPTLLERIGFERLEPVLIQRDVANEPIDQFIEKLWGAELRPEIRAAVWRIRLMRASSIKWLKSLLLEEGVRPHEIPWNEQWLSLRGRRRDLATVLVLAARRAPQQLYSLSAILGAENLKFGLRAAAACLPRSDRRDIGFLELAAELGPEAITRLAAVLAMTDKSAASGHRLDRTYARYLLPKQSGGTRTISVPNPIVKIIQRSILDRLLNDLGAHECAYGFVPRRSIKDNALIHVGRKVVANIDIQNCFPSVRWQLVFGALRRDLAHRLSPGTISLLVDICTAEGGLPIGAPTSPALLNRVLLRTDQILVAAADKLGSRYTRYADDLTFSGDHSSVHLLGIAKRTLSQIGLQIDPGKTSIYRPGRRQIVTGLVVNEKVNIPRRLRRRMRAAVHAVENGRVPHWNNAPESVESLRGRLAFSQGINPEQAGPLVRRLAGAPIAIEADRDPPEGPDDG